MKPDKLRDLINELTQDIEFSYKGVDGSICPFSRSDISLFWNGKNRDCKSLDEVMEDSTVLGAPLSEIAEQLLIY